MPIFFLSEALFPLRSLPKAVAFVSTINPLAYRIDGLRIIPINASHLGVGFLIVGRLFYRGTFRSKGSLSDAPDVTVRLPRR
jgi:hypothetical protein